MNYLTLPIGLAIYKQLEGKKTNVLGWRDAKHAQKLIRESHQRWKDFESRKSLGRMASR